MTVEDAQRAGSHPQPVGRLPVGRLVVVGTIVLIVLGWATLFQLIQREKTEAIEKAAAVNLSLTHAFAEHVHSGITLIDTYSWQLATEIEKVGIDRVRLGAHLRQLDSALPFVQQIGVVGADGTLAASAPAFPRVDLADREHFRFHSNNTDAKLFIGRPVRYRSSGKWTIPFSRRLYAYNGAFAGVLVIGLDAEYFSSYYSSLSLGGGDAMTIARRDGVVVMRRTGDRIEYAQAATELPWFEAAQATRVGWSVLDGATDGMRRIAAYESMLDYPLTLALGTPFDDALAGVYGRLPNYYNGAGAVTAALLLAALMIALLFRRRARTSYELAASEARFRSLTALSSDWYWEQDEQFRTTFRSNEVQRKSGAVYWPKKGARRWDEPALNLSEADWAKHRAQLDRHESFHDFEVERAASQGGSVWLSLSGEPVFGPDGQFRGYRGVARSITERKRTERLLTLEHSIARCMAANEATDNVMHTIIRTTCETHAWQCGMYYTRDREAGVLRLANAWSMPDPAAEALVDASQDWVYRPGEGLAGVAWQTGEPVWEEDLLNSERTKYGISPTMVGTSVRSAFLFPALAEGEVLGVFAFSSTDIRERDARLMQTASAIGHLVGLFVQRRRAEQDLVQLNTELEQRVAERTAALQSSVGEMEAFTYTVAHDLRSPLRAMNGYCEILIGDYEKAIPEEGRKYLRRVAANAGRLGNLIDDLLAFSRCSRVALNKVQVNMEALVAEIVTEHAPAGERTRLCVGALPGCVGDPSLLRQVITNLVSNAIKYSRNATASMVEIGHADGAYFVRDNGVGFDMQYASKLFGVFSRLHRAEEFEGTGVGLAIVKRIVDRHGGRVWAQAESGRGATFSFTLG